ncbi:N-acetylmuramoyl-L-alanine amidase [Candidatus Puniceispirillum sp.]|nr:N-acetylmuramoyl-L-alanine amidase [Candidatus Puniceispirillum sp.]
MVKISSKLDKETMRNMLLVIALWVMKTLSGRCLKIIVMLLVTTASGNVFAKNKVTGMRVGVVQIEGRAGFRLVVETQSPLKASLLLLQSPYRLVIDMPETNWAVDKLPQRGQLLVKPGTAYRFGTPRPNVGRLVLELERPAAPIRAFSLPPSDGGNRFVIDLLDRGKTAFLVAASALAKNPKKDFGAQMPSGLLARNANKVPVEKPLSMPLPKSKPSYLLAMPASSKLVSVERPTPAKKTQKWVVFIDAGHGGKDPGAIGKAGTHEKIITLAAAQELARQLKATDKIIPILARNDDRYLRLRQRINLARQSQADLFISLHADSAHSSMAHGISVFTLSETASDKEAAILARKENDADLIGGPDLAIEDPEAAGALLRMFQRESMNQSARFAAAILKQIRGLPGGDKRGHRFAGFAVLKAPDMPSVLVEMGFLSNHKDEANLKSKSYRQDLSRRLTKAIVSYLNEYGPKI